MVNSSEIGTGVDVAGAIALVAGTASEIVATTIAQSSGTIGAVVENYSNIRFRVIVKSPNFGHLLTPPSSVLFGPNDEYTLFQASLNEKFQNNPTPEQTSAELKLWEQSHLFNSSCQNAVLLFSGMGDGNGFEVMVGLISDHVRIYLLIRKRPSGYYGCGLSLSDEAWDYNFDADDLYGSNIMNHIKTVDPGLCIYSNGGSGKSATMGAIKAEFQAPGTLINFKISNVDETGRQILIINGDKFPI